MMMARFRLMVSINFYIPIYFLVSFRLICFRPSMDEAIIGSVKNCTKEGIQVSLNFFDDIFIPAAKLKHPSKLLVEFNQFILLI